MIISRQEDFIICTFSITCEILGGGVDKGVGLEKFIMIYSTCICVMFLFFLVFNEKKIITFC